MRAEIKNTQELHIVLKISERCNLACSYCYFFFGGDESYKVHPPLIKEDVLEQLNSFILNAIEELSVKRFLIVLHGGEPLLMKKTHFQRMLDGFYNTLNGKAALKLSVQTNGILLDNAWFDIFKKYKVSVGISLDGPKKYNDKFRVDKKGNGSHEKVVAALEKLSLENRGKVGCLSVVNPSFDPRVIYNHFIHELQFSGIDALLPDIKHDDKPQNVPQIGEYLCNLFDVWLEQDNPEISIRIFENIINQLLGYEEHMIDTTYEPEKVVLLSISSSGIIYYEDTLKSVMTSGNYNIFNTSLKQYLNTNEFKDMVAKTQKLPDGCLDCIWKKICRGGRMVNRFSSSNGFNNPSVLCDALKAFYSHVAKRLMERNIKKERIVESLTYNCKNHA